MADRERNWKFINRTLNDAEIGQYREWFGLYPNGLDGVISDALAAGFKISLSWIDNQNAFVASLTGSDRTANNGGRTMTAWSDEYADAIGMVTYKHFVLAVGGDWDAIHNTSQRLG